jgi:hypothetical protein
MKELKYDDSIKIVDSFLLKIKRDIKKGEIPAEFFELTLQEPIYEVLSCAFIQNANKTEGILYDGYTNSFFYLKTQKVGNPTLNSLSKSVSKCFPKSLLEKMFWVCGNKKDGVLNISDFGEPFSLLKAGK